MSSVRIKQVTHVHQICLRILARLFPKPSSGREVQARDPIQSFVCHGSQRSPGDDAQNRDGAQPRPSPSGRNVQDGNRGRRGGGQEGARVHDGHNSRGAGGQAHERADPVLPPPADRGLPRGAEPEGGWGDYRGGLHRARDAQDRCGDGGHDGSVGGGADCVRHAERAVARHRSRRHVSRVQDGWKARLFQDCGGGRGSQAAMTYLILPLSLFLWGRGLWVLESPCGRVEQWCWLAGNVSRSWQRVASFRESLPSERLLEGRGTTVLCSLDI
ncbi:unnamed protein product [Ectocarpus fasciculatus]